MVLAPERKLFLGARLKRLRRELGLTQARMAQDLNVSPSYLNHLERNQRPLTAQILLRLAETYDIDIRALSGGEGKPARDLGEVLIDPIFRDLAIPRHEIAEVAENAPGVSDAIVRLYRAFSDRRRFADAPAAAGAAPTALAVTPSDWVRDYIEGQHNFFPELDEIGEALADALDPGVQDVFATASRRLAERHGVQVRIAPTEVLPEQLRRFDHHRRRLLLSERLGAAGRAFAAAYQLGLLEHGPDITALMERAGAPDLPTSNLLRVSLANYLAAAVIMPYEAFRRACESYHYDLEPVAMRFGASFEQAAQRLTTLSRPAARGVPFFMLRIDAAGNISKRFGGGTFPFSRFGGGCPRWRIHAAFRSPGKILTQIVETPGGGRYFTFARTVPRIAVAFAEEDSELAVGLGCELKYAGRLAYARGIDLAAPVVTEIGSACRVCERPNCPQRAAEPVSRTLAVDDFSKSISSFPFEAG
jgi:predicted transcriptional regulator/transcriptional regulator with XRE-family HTH domain